MNTETPLTVVPFTESPCEAARLIGADAAPLASVLDPPVGTEPAAFRDAVLSAALEHEGVAGVLFAKRWGGGGVMLT